MRPLPDAYELTSGSLIKGLMRLSGPLLLSALLQNAQSLIDLFWVGRLGSIAVAGVALSATVFMLLFPMIMGLTAGTVAMVARMTGAGDGEGANRAAGQSLMLSLILGGITGMVCSLFSEPVLRLLGADAQVVRMGAPYLRILLLGSFSVFLLFTANAALQAVGDTVRPMWSMILANVLNLILDPLLIFGFGPFPEMGIEGAAWATVFSQVVACAVSIHLMKTGKSRLKVQAHHWKLDWALSWRILRIGVPGSGQMLSRGLMAAAFMRIVAQYGTVALAAYGIGMRFHMILLMPAFAFGNAAATLVGQNMGAGQLDRARAAAWLATAIDAGLMILCSIAVAIWAGPLVSFFSSDPAVIAVGVKFLRIVTPFAVFATLGIVLGRAMNGAGETLMPMILTVVSLWGLQVPLGLWLPHHWHPATSGIWWANALAMMAHGILIMLWFLKGHWQRQRV
jgi:putative MATE family efflux protein